MPRPTKKTGEARWLLEPRHIRAILLVLLGLMVTAVAVRMTRGILSGRETTYPEGSVIFNVLELAAGQPLFRDVNRQPHVYTPYGPLLYVVGAFATRLIGVSAEVATVTVRSLTVLFALLAGWGIARLARGAGATQTGSWVGGILFLAAPPMLGYGYTARPDLWALCSSLWAFVVGLRRPGTRGAALAGLLFGIAFLAKPVAFGALLTLAYFYWSGRRRVEILILMGSVTTIFAGAFIVQYLWAGEAFLRSFRVILSVTPNLRTPPNLLLTFVRICAPAVMLACFAVASGRTKIEPPWPCVFLCTAAGVAAVTALRIGDLNHTLELLAAVCVLAAIGWDRIAVTNRARSARVMGSLALLVVLVPHAGEAASVMLHALDPLPRLDPELVRRLDPISEPILSQASDIPVWLRKPPALLDPLLFSYAERSQQWDPEPLITALRSRRVGAVILNTSIEGPPPEFQRFPVWPRGVLETIRQAYREDARGTGWVMYVPKDPERASYQTDGLAPVAGARRSGIPVPQAAATGCGGWRPPGSAAWHAPSWRESVSHGDTCPSA